MADPIGDAFITIHPDLSKFQAELTAQLLALQRLQTVGIQVPVTPIAGAGAGAAGVAAAAGSTDALAAANARLAAAAAEAAIGETAAGAAAARMGAQQSAAAAAGLSLAGAQSAVNAATRAGGANLANTAADVANLASAASGAPSALNQLNKGLNGTTTSGNAARGALIGLSRITPVAIFGLGAAGTAAVAAGLAFRSAVIEIAKFEEQLNVFEVVADASADEMSRISQLAKDLGADLSLPATSANDAAAAMTELAKAGVSVNDVLDATRGVLQLAAASGTGAAEAARITAFALNAFSLEGEEAAKIADLLAAASISAQGEITDMAQALTQASAVAAQAGISVQDTTTAISLLAKSGLLGSDAGTSLRTTILRLVPTTKEAAETVEALGVSFQDASGNLLPLSQIFQQYQEQLAGLTETTQQAALTQIFGQDAIRAASIFAREGAQGFEDMAEQVEKEGVAARVADARTKGLSGAAAGLGSNLSTLGITLGGVVAGPMTDFLNSLSAVVSGVNAAAEGIGGLVSSFNDLIAPNIVAPEDIQGVEALRDAIAEVNEKIGDADEEGRFVPPVLLERLRQLVAELDKTQESGVAATRTIEDFRAALSQAAAEAARQKDLDPFPDREDLRASVSASIQAVKDAIDSQRQTLQSSLETLLRLGPESEGALSDQLRTDVVRAVAELKKLGPAGEAAIADLPARLRKVMRIAMQGLVEEADIEIPLRFTISQDLASLTDTLQDDLTTALATEASLAKRVEAAVPGTKLYAELLKLQAAAHQKVKGIQGQIEAQAKAAASDRKQRADDAVRAINEADQAVLDALERGRTPFERRLERAEGTPGESDNIRALKALEKRIEAEIDQVVKTVRNAKTKAQQLRALGDDLFQVNQELRDANQSLRDELTENLGKTIDLRELQGNRDATLKAFDRAIADARDRVRHWKRLGLVLLDEQIALAQLIQDRKDFLKEFTGGESPDVFVDRLFQEAAEQFGRFGSNISSGGSGILSPQGARGAFANILLGNPRANGGGAAFDAQAERTRQAQLAESKKQTGYLATIAGRENTKIVKGTPVAPEDRSAKEVQATKRGL